MPTIDARLGLSALAILCAAMNAPDGGAPVTLSFQNGLGGYAGARDLTLSSQYLEQTGGRGATERKDPELCAFVWTEAPAYVDKTLLAFDLSSLPRTAKVAGASLEITVDTWSADARLDVSYLAVPWDYSSSHLGWSERSSTARWSKPGIGPGDLVAGKRASATGWKPIGVQTRAIPLDPDEVQAWVRDPKHNFGLLLEGTTPGAVLKIRSSEHPDLEHRPKLLLTLE